MTRSILGLLVALGLSAGAVSTGFAQSPPVLPLQGYLTDTNGVPIDGSHRLTFTLYDAATDGNQLFVDDYTSLTLQEGRFIVYLGSQGAPALDLGAFNSTSTAYIEVVVDGTEVISPRIQIGSVAYAAVANHCGDADTVEGMGAAAFAPASHTHPTPTPTVGTLENGWVFWEATTKPHRIARTATASCT